MGLWYVSNTPEAIQSHGKSLKNAAKVIPGSHRLPQLCSTSTACWSSSGRSRYLFLVGVMGKCLEFVGGKHSSVLPWLWMACGVFKTYCKPITREFSCLNPFKQTVTRAGQLGKMLDQNHPKSTGGTHAGFLRDIPSPRFRQSPIWSWWAKVVFHPLHLHSFYPMAYP